VLLYASIVRISMLSSSDTWIIQKGFRCLDIDGTPLPESECAFGTSGFVPSRSPTFVADKNQNLNITYGDGTFVVGPTGQETITVGGLTVTNQKFGVPTIAQLFGADVASGLLGLAYPALTSVFNTSDPTQDSITNLAPYNPFFFTAIQEKKVSTPGELLQHGSACCSELNRLVMRQCSLWRSIGPRSLRRRTSTIFPRMASSHLAAWCPSM
jgi:hypothetical protein